MTSTTTEAPPRQRRIGLYGGTFDPVHLAHLITAQDALEQLHLDELLFIPAYISPFKTGSSASDATHRLEMLRLSLQDSPGFRLLDTEITRAAPSYAIDSVLDIRATNPGAELFFLIGEDHLPTLHLWHRIAELQKIIQFVVQTRTQYVPAGAPMALHSATDVLKSGSTATLATAATPGNAAQATTKISAAEASAAVICLPNSRHVDISATEIRRRVQQRLPIHFLVTPAVARYIAAHRLYQD